MMNPMQPSEFFSQMTSNAVEAFSLCAEANQKILRELVDLSASAAKEGVRLYAELQSSAVSAATCVPMIPMAMSGPMIGMAVAAAAPVVPASSIFCFASRSATRRDLRAAKCPSST